ncbi:MAG: sensor domain-containing diguanylate cyclase [Pseudolabrys sp.]
MARFFVSQLDFILFFYGLAFILLGSVCVAIARSGSSAISWGVLGVFGYLHGTSEWLDLSALVFGDPAVFALARTVLMAVSFMALFEFARRELGRLQIKVPGVWVQIPLLALPVLGWHLAGTGGANVVARYAFGLTGALMTCAVFVLNSRTVSRGERRWLLCVAVAFALYGIVAGGVVPSVPRWQGDFFNYDDFTRLTEMPVQFVRGLLACFVAFSAWAFWGHRAAVDIASSRYSRFQRGQFAWTLIALGTILAGGWVLTEYLGNIYRQNVQDESIGDINLISSRLKGETATVDGMVRALAGSRSVALAAASGEAVRARAILQLETEASGANAGFILNRSGTVIVSTDTAESDEASNHKAAPYFTQALVSRAGSFFSAEGPSKTPRYYASYPVRNSRGAIVAVAVLEKSLYAFASDLRRFDRSFALVDPNGVVLLTNRPAMQFRTLWPLPATVAAAMREKYGAINPTPALKSEIYESDWVTFDGNRDYVQRRAIPQSDWSLMTWKVSEGIFASRVLGIIMTLQMTILALVYLIGRERWIYDNIQLEKRLELEELARNLDFRATTDPLTGLFNRRKFDRILAAEMLRAQRYKAPLSIVLYDVDHFKQVNDSFGHQVGDNVLTELSRFVGARIRNSDALARWGGEEFVILCPGGNGAMACQLAGNLRDAIAALAIEGAGNVTCSFGVAQYEDGDTPESFLTRADGALYRAKLNGRNTVELAAQPVIATQALQQVG